MERDMKEKGFSVVRLRLVIFNCVFKVKKKKKGKRKGSKEPDLPEGKIVQTRVWTLEGDILLVS